MKMNQKESEEIIAFRMVGSIRFEKSLETVNFVSLGCFEMRMDGKVISFDFEEIESWKDKEDPAVLHFECRNPDYETFDDLYHVTKHMLQNVSEIIDFLVDVDMTDNDDENWIEPTELEKVAFVLPYDNWKNIEIPKEVLKTFKF